jgi:hypothetical protein
MIKIVGKKIISGDLNLTRISFPIKAMVPKTALENSTMSCCMNPYFMKKACETKDPLERFKYVITNTIAAFYYITMFLKPVRDHLRSSIQSLDRLFKESTLMGHRFTVSKFHTILQSATSWLLVHKIVTSITVAITSQPSQDLTQCLWSIRDTKFMSSQTERS